MFGGQTARFLRRVAQPIKWNSEMNKYLYHVIFNERRGQCIVVPERVSGGARKSGGSVTVNFGTGPGCVDRRHPAPILHPVALVLRSAFGVAASIAVPAYAQIIADPNAPGKQRPTVLETANGVVQVNIQTPSQAGVSRNTYTQFDVTRGGAVLNNSRTAVQTQIGGWVQANPWLLQGPARVILNEVNSSNPSQLRGYLEVAGQRAEVVIANPSGIDVDGAGFINASRVTLTTGVPRLQDGNLEGIAVQQGSISVTGQGLDAGQTDYAGILARAVIVNANIWAKELRIVTGANQIDATAAATPVAGSGSAPNFALDVAQLGGMYAGQITLVGTEAGVGVRNAGTIAATSGNLVLNANGWLTNSGTILASAPKTGVDIEAAGDITNSGTLYAAGDINVTSRGDIASTGLIAAQYDATVLGAGATSRIDGGSGAIFASGLMADGTMLGTGDLSLRATTSVSHHGTALGGAALRVSGSELDLSHATLTGDQINAVASTANLDASGAAITAKGLLVLNSAKTLDTHAAKLVAEQLRIGAQDWSNVGGEVLQSGSGDTDITLTDGSGTLDNTSGRIAVNSANLTLGAGRLVNTDGRIEHASTGTLAIRAQTIDDQRGTIIGNGALDISAGSFDHRDATTSASQVNIAAGSLDNEGGHIAQVGAGRGAITVSGHLDNSSGTIESNGNASVNTGTLDNSGGRITAIGSAIVRADARLNNASGLVAAGMDLAIQGGSIDNSHGTLQAQGGDATLRVSDLNNVGGNVFAARRLDTVASDVVNTGTLYAGADQNLTVSGAVTSSGVIAAQGNTTVSAHSLSIGAGGLLGAGVSMDGTLAQNGDLSITTTDTLAAHGQNLAAGQSSLQGAAVDLSGSQTAGASIALRASTGDVSTSGATVATAGTLAITATTEGHGLVNAAGTLSGTQLDVQVANLDNRQGTLIQSGIGDTSIAMSSPSGVLDNTGGRIAINANNFNLSADTLTNVDGHVEHAGMGVLNIKADTLSNHGGHLLHGGAGSMALEVAAQLDNAGGEIASEGSLGLQAGAIDNSRGRITSGDSAMVGSAGQLNNSSGVLTAAHSLAAAVGAVDNTAGALQAGDGALTLDAANLQNSKGVLSAGTDLTARIAGDLSNDSVVYAGRDQVLNLGGALINTGSIASQGDATMIAASIDSGAGSLLGGGIRADGSLAQSGSLTVHASGTVVATGQNLAVGDVSMSGASVDVRGSQTAGGNITLTAGSGDVHTAGANLSTAGTLGVTAGHLDNAQGNLGAGQLSLHVANLDNTHGTVVQTGTGDTDITLSAPDGRLDNTAGHIAVNSANLTLGASTLVNTDGKIEHAGAGTLAIRAGTLDGQRGQIAGNGALDISATAIDHRDAITSANQIAITAASLDNHGGHIAHLGTGVSAITVSGSLDNGAGTIESNGDAVVNAGSLDNSGGRITAAGSAAIGAQVSLNNTDGLLAAGMNLAVQGGAVDNTHGTVQAQGGDATVRVGDLSNTGGAVYAAGKLDTVAANVANTGSLYAGGDQRLEVSGAVSNSGVIAAQGNTTVTAQSLSSAAGSLLGAGVKADGMLAQNGDLSITTTDTLAAHGQNLAAGQASLQGAAVDLSGSQTGGAGIALRASTGDVTTSGATVATAGTLAITATTERHGLVNAAGTLSGTQLDFLVANLNNQQGALLQSGTVDASIAMSSPSGVLDNTEGRIAVNANNLNLNAATLTNVDGHIEHAGTGTLHITAGTFNDERGSVASNGMLALAADALNHNDATTSAAGVSVHAGVLSNRGGHLLQGGAGSMALEVAGQLDNAGGEIASEGSLGLQAGAINNSHGRITSGDSATVGSAGQLNNSSGVLTAAHSLAAAVGVVDNTAGALQAGDGALTLDAANLQNSKGVLSAGTDLTARIAGDLSNDSVVYAGRDQVLNLGGALINTGSIASQGDATMIAASIDSGAGSLLGGGIRADGSLAQSGSLTVHASGTVVATGQNLAVGDVSMSGASVDVRGSQTAGGNITLTAGSGDVHTAGANLSTAGTLGVTAGHLDNAQGNLGAGQLSLHVANLDNTHGTVVQTGTGDTDITLSAPDGRLDNTAGHIAVNSANLTLGASTLVNTDGKIEHAGAGTLAIRAGTLDGQRGQIAGNGALDISATAIDHRDAITSANQIAITAASLDNHGGHIAHLGTGVSAITVSGSLDNGAGTIESNGDAVVNAGSLDNSGGRITAAGSAAIGAQVSLNNTDGLLAAGMNLAVQGGAVDNTHGTVQAQGGDATVRVGDLSNTGGAVYAAGKLDTVAANVANTGSLYAGGDQRLEVSGAVSNSGVIAAQGNTTVTAQSLSSAAGSLLGAGVKADGMLAQNGDLSITTTDTLAAHGQNLAAGQASLQGAAVDLSGSQTGGAGIALRASTGDVTTSGATVATAGTLAITATTERHGLVNAAGTLSGTQLDFLVANLNNQQGALLQSGTVDASIAMSSPSGVLDNTEGRIAANANNLNLRAATLINVDGRIEHAGTGRFDLAAGEIYDQHGEMIGNGEVQITTGAFNHREATTSAERLIITAGTLDNSQGIILQKGDANTSISTTSTLNNGGGTIASNGSTTISAGELTNAGGRLSSASAGDLTIQAAGKIDNSQGGVIAAAAGVDINGGEILNQSGKINSGGRLAVNAAGPIQNDQGSIVAHGNAQLTATQLANSHGTIATELGTLNINTSGVTNNDSGVIQAGGDLSLTNNGLSNSQASGESVGGSVVGRNVDIESNGQPLSNHLGTIASSQNLSLHSGALDNAGGLIQSGEALVLDTNGGDLDNSDSASYTALHPGSAGGIVSAGKAQLRVGAWNNAGGFLGSGGSIDAEATGKLENTSGGQIVGASDLGLTASSLDNQGGQIQSMGNLTVKAAAGDVNNSGSLIRAGGTLDISANKVDNSNTAGTGQGFEGQNVALTTSTLNNDHGAIRADENVDIHGGVSVINTQGLISAGQTLTVGAASSDPGLSIGNNGGTLIGGSSVNIKAASMNGGGHLLSLGDLALELSGDFAQAQGGELVADKSLSLKVSGDISNSGKLSAGTDLDIEARNVDNAASGEIISSGVTHVTTADTLRNRGLIDGNATEIDAGTVDNAGTGRIYGGNVSIAACAVNNDVENGTAGTIAARSRLDIGVQTLNNREHALIFSGGDLAIRGALDANRLAIGRADTVTNASASIEAMGNLILDARQVNNLNNHFTTELRVTKTESITEYSADNQPTHYSSIEAQVIPASNDPDTVKVLHVNGQDHDVWAQYNYIRTTEETVIASSDPGRIAAGGILVIGGDGVLNDNSHIAAGGLAIIMAPLSNSESPGQRITSDAGYATLTTRIYLDGHDRDQVEYSPYKPPATIELVPISDSRVEQQTATVDGSAPGQTAAGGVAASTSNAGQATADVNAGTTVKVSTSVGTVTAASGSDASNVSAAGGRTGTDIDDGSAHLVSIDSATGEHVTVSGSVGQASSADPMAVGYSSRQIVGSEVGRTSEAVHQNHADSLDADSARLASIGSAQGERAAISSLSGQASAADPMRVGLSSRQVAINDVGRSAGQTAQARTAAIAARAHQGIDPASGLPVSMATDEEGAGGTVLSAPAIPGVNSGSQSSTEIGKAEGIAPSGRTQALGVAQSALEHAAGGAQVVRTSAPSAQLPAASLFQVHPSQSAGYLVETDPRFANYQQWTGSDYMFAQMTLDPALTQKRLGDGFYEQKLVRDQLAQLTGQRFLGDYTSDDEQYRGLMDAGIAYAKELNLRPGVALTAEQMSALTKDMVWLVAQDVTLADGTVQKVLAPQVYVVSHDQDPTGAGAVISGRDVKVTSTGDLTNTGTIFARNTVQLVADNINNLGGRIHAGAVLASASTDINDIGGTISAGHELILTAGRDINVDTTTRSASSSVGGNQFGRTTIDGIGSLSVTGAGGTLVASAGRDINLVAAKIDNAGKDGNTLLDAGRNLNLATVTTASSNSLVWDPVRYRKEASSTEVGTVIQGAGAITFKAGIDINMRAASVDAGKDLTAIAGNNLNVLAGVATATFDQTSQTTKSGFLHHETITTRNTLDSTNAIGSVLGGATVNLAAGHDLKVVGSSVVGDDNVNLAAKNAISIEAATNQSHETHYVNVKESGLLSGGGFGINYGKRTTTTNQDQDASIQSGQARSTIGSIAGNVTMSADDAIKIAGTDLQAGHDLNLLGKSVSITPGVDDVTGKFTTKMTQDALSLSIGGSVVNAIQSTQQMSSAAGQTSSSRLKALAAASAAMTVKDAAEDLAKNWPSLKVSLTVGHSESESTELTASSTHGGSVLTAGNNVAISATGGGKASNIDIVGSDVRAKGSVGLAADNQVNLLAAQDTESQHSQSKSSSASVGVAAELSASKSQLGVTASASASRGNVDGEGTTQVNSHVSAGDRLTITSGGDTNLKGAVASGSQVVTDIKGNLNIESLQDTAILDGKRQSASVSGTVGAGAGLSASASQSKVHDDYASVQEQSGIKAGDGGFQVHVAGNTDLKGGVISGSEQAIKDGRNGLATGTLSFSDVQNHDSTEASGVNLGMNVGKNQNGSTFSPSMAPGIGHVGGSQASVTKSGVSDATVTIADLPAGQAPVNLNRDVITGKDTAQALTKGWTSAQALDEVGAQMQITSAAMPRLASEIGDYATVKVAELIEQGKAEEAAKWEEGGVYRIAAHAALGAMGGGLNGALGAGSSAAAAPFIGKAINDVNLPGLARTAAITAVGAAVGAVTGGTAGAVAGGNQIANNYLRQHGVGIKKSEQAQFDYVVAACNNGDQSACERRDGLIALSQQRDQLITNVCAAGPSADCNALISAATSAGNKAIFGSDGKAVVYPLGSAELRPTPNVQDNTFHDELAKSTLDALLMASGDAAVAQVTGLVGKGVAAAVNAATIVRGGASMETAIGEEALAAPINNFYRDGPSSTLLQQTFDQAALSSTHNARATEVILGKHIEGSPASYEAVAKIRGATYFSMSDWSVVESQLGADQMWNINKAFLNQQMAQEKTFIFTVDPLSDAAGFYTKKEFSHLSENGYFLVKSGGFYRAIKK
jgi:filamentous hemagglutinin